MKKHELLQKAMKDYPKGTIAVFKSAPNVEHVSDGVFEISDINHDGKLHIISGKGLNCFYSDGEWAEPIKEKLIAPNSDYPVLVTKYGAVLTKCGLGNEGIRIRGFELEDIYKAYKSFQ